MIGPLLRAVGSYSLIDSQNRPIFDHGGEESSPLVFALHKDKKRRALQGAEPFLSARGSLSGRVAGYRITMPAENVKLFCVPWPLRFVSGPPALLNLVM